MKEVLLHARETQAAYGRWLLASLLAVHTGAILAITQAGTLSYRLFAASGQYLVWGIVVTLIAGGLTWINFSASVHFLNDSLNGLRLGKEPERKGVAFLIGQGTFYAVPAVALGSLVLAGVAAHSALQVVSADQAAVLVIPDWTASFLRWIAGISFNANGS
jgi:hypothetical protein